MIERMYLILSLLHTHTHKHTQVSVFTYLSYLSSIYVHIKMYTTRQCLHRLDVVWPLSSQAGALLVQMAVLI